MKVTSHYDEWAWVDFVRGVGRSDVRSAMELHLSSGCQRCLRVVRVLRGVAGAAPSDAQSAPSPQAVRRAEAIFPLHRPETTVFARLVYDSFREPLPAGMRAQDRVARHALYEAGNVFLDLQLEHERASGVITLVGQISDRERPGVNTVRLPVSLMAGKNVVASAMCNRLGEFELEYKPARDLWLHVPLQEGAKHVGVRMDELSPKLVRRTAAPAKRKRRAGSTKRIRP
jgi:hypothetical protein